ncbi:MAG: creatininase family protein [Chloroflexota bacterium]
MDTVTYAVSGIKTLAEMSWDEVDRLRQKTDIAILTAGSTEAHGTHMPLAADTIQGQDGAKRIAARLSAEGLDILVAPTIPFGISTELMPFPGTISLRPSTLIATLLDVGKSLAQHGFTKQVLLLSHDGNLAAMQVAAQELNMVGVDCLFLNWLPVLAEQYPNFLRSTKREGHAGEAETARVVASQPELVHLDRAHVYYPEQSGAALPGERVAAFGGPLFQPILDMRRDAPWGSIGDPTLATAETGERCYQIVLDWACPIIKKRFGLPR